MVVSKIEQISKSKSRVFLDGQFAFVLYKGELSRYRIKENEEISSETVQDIKDTVLKKRVKLRAMHLLNQMDRTEEQLRKKLKENEYTDDLVEIAIQYVKSFGYIDDVSYIERFISLKKDKKSKKELQYLLMQKGLSSDLICEVMEEVYTKEDQIQGIREILRKKKYSFEDATEKEKEKMMAYLLRKGFPYQEVKNAMHAEWEETL